MTRPLAVITLLLLVGATTRPATPGDAIAAYARQQLGHQVGNGECTRLVEAAMRSAGAARQRGDDPGEGDYVWGELVVRAEADGIKQGTPADIKPGDTLQFRDARFEHRDPRGAKHTNTFDHHSAIVDQVNTRTGAVTFLHQNFNGSRTVSELQLDLKNLKAGWVRVYRPIYPSGGSGPG